MDEPKLMRLRYPGVCRICDSPIERGVRALYEPAHAASSASPVLA